MDEGPRTWLAAHMVAYQPPDHVLASIGAAFPSAAVLSDGRPLLAAASEDRERLAAVGLEEAAILDLEDALTDLEALQSDPKSRRQDTGLQMQNLSQTLAEVRAWLRTLRYTAGIHLAADAPALARLVSAAPEMAEPYPRDQWAELDRRLSACHDLASRWPENNDIKKFIARGEALKKQLWTAIGAEDVQPENLSFAVRRLYLRKGQCILLLKRIQRAGAVAHLSAAARRAAYRLPTLEPELVQAYPSGSTSPTP